ncbi:F0F1 ATP synthase subunit gamma [Roseicella sp. DB1501]|uniref:F0F1 ATP synthase subunit gamma n=1 Tax=Roseicella sp. DB1501 TaxID=2730925 RepID=UPI001490B8A7|nr:F0F1 ATP synthase subunit gamma [Roseicella sp. DB1501]NOG69077.1 ATPase [Roseicella sp. DB1501]
MTERLAEVSTRLDTVRQLGMVVGAMRGMAAARAQQSRNLLPAIRTYAQVALDAMAQGLSLMPPGDPAPPARGGAAGLIAFCGEQGFAGAFTERVLDALATRPGGSLLFLIGTRGTSRAAERGLAAAWSAPMASHVDGLPRLARRLGEAVYAAIRDRGIARIDLMLPDWSPERGLRVETRALLPLDYRRFAGRRPAQPPLVNLPPAVLVEGIAEEYVHALLQEAVAIAFAAENEARVAAMASARSNIDRMLAELGAEERQIRQDSITAEVIELASAARSASQRSHTEGR